MALDLLDNVFLLHLALEAAPPTAADADALSTAFYLLGPEAASAYAAAHPDVGIIIVQEDAADRLPRVLTFGLEPEDFLIDGNSVNSILAV